MDDLEDTDLAEEGRDKGMYAAEASVVTGVYGQLTYYFCK